MDQGPKRRCVKLLGPKQKMEKLGYKHPYLNREGNNVKDLQEVRHKIKEAREVLGRKAGSKMGPGWLAQAGPTHFRLGSPHPFITTR
jgi:hypothetical protein